MVNYAPNKTDKDLIRNIVESYTFLDFALVKSGDITKVTVELLSPRNGQTLVLEDVELVTLGSAACSITVTPTEGDLVLLLGLRSYIADLSSVTRAQDKSSNLHYTLSNVKAIQIAPAKDSKAVIAVDADGNIAVTGESITLNGDTKNFVTHTELDSALQTFIAALVTHVHATAAVGPPSPPTVMPPLSLSIDIAAAKTTTVKTGG